jgi:hypothetical protein
LRKILNLEDWLTQNPYHHLWSCLLP